MDGDEVISILKNKQAKNNLPIIIQTAFAMTDMKDEAFKAGCNNLIVKPISIDAFLMLVNTYIVQLN